MIRLFQPGDWIWIDFDEKKGRKLRQITSIDYRVRNEWVSNLDKIYSIEDIDFFNINYNDHKIGFGYVIGTIFSTNVQLAKVTYKQTRNKDNILKKIIKYFCNIL